MIQHSIMMVLLIAGMLFASQDPVQAIRKKDAELQGLIKKANQSPKEKERIKHLLNESFDFALLAKKSLPTSVWKAQDVSSQENCSL